ncbi:unnamed protein product [Ectocarpus fasciculatus]
MFGADARSVLSFSSHRWGEQPLTSGNGGGTGGHEDMGKSGLRIPFGSGSQRGPPRVWLSAAETDASHAGLMEGALCAGKRVAEQVILAGIVAPKQNATAKGQEQATCTASGGITPQANLRHAPYWPRCEIRTAAMPPPDL